MHFWQSPKGGGAVELPQHVGLEVVGDQLVALEVRAVHPHLSQQPITGRVRGHEDWILRTRGLLQLKGGRVHYTKIKNTIDR